MLKCKDYGKRLLRNIRVKKRDKNKYDKCVNNGITLLYYTDLIEYVNETYLTTIYANTDELILNLKRNKHEGLL